MRKIYKIVCQKTGENERKQAILQDCAQINVEQYFIQEIEKIFRKYTPEEIYYKILFELFNSDLDLDGGIEHSPYASYFFHSTTTLSIPAKSLMISHLPHWGRDSARAFSCCA